MLLLLLGAAAACGSDDTSPGIDAAGGDDGGGGDSAQACTLPAAPITCTVGDNSPCAAMCGDAYCYNFMQAGTVCTEPCTPQSTDQCPTGWRCNDMGRCRPP